MKQNHPRSPSQRGVTLIELLIAVSLMSLLTVGIVYAMRLAINSQERANNKLMANRRITGAQRILEQQVANFMPVIAECRQSPVAPPSPASPVAAYRRTNRCRVGPRSRPPPAWVGGDLSPLSSGDK